VGYLRPELRIDAEFVAAARTGRDPEKRFRFAQPCVEGRCAHWTGSRCGVIENVLDSEHAPSATGRSGPVPRCSIRPRCRWFAEHGTRACAACPLVVTEPAGARGTPAPHDAPRMGIDEEEAIRHAAGA